MAERDSGSRRPLLVTGAHRSGTTWVGRMIDLSPEVGYINEPFNPHHQPGICRCRFPLWFQYVDRHNEHRFRPHLSATLAFRYRPVAQLARTRRLATSSASSGMVSSSLRPACAARGPS